MSTGGVRRRRTAAGLLLGIAVAGLACSPVASASPGQIVDMAEQCPSSTPAMPSSCPRRPIWWHPATPSPGGASACPSRQKVESSAIWRLTPTPTAAASTPDLPSSASPTHPTGNAPAEPRASFGASTR